MALVDLQSIETIEGSLKISALALSRTFRGVIVASKLPEEHEHAQAIHRWIASAPISSPSESADARTLSSWLRAAQSAFSAQPDAQHIVNLTTGVAYLREYGRCESSDSGKGSPAMVDFVWTLIRRALTGLPSLFGASRSAVGFLFVPLCSLLTDGKIDELWRLHVWLPDGQRGSPEFGVHAHNTFTQSWILAGEGTNHAWSVSRGEPAETATHAEYRLAWSGADNGNGGGGSSAPGRLPDGAYKTHQTSSTVTNSGVYARATHLASEQQTRGTSYTVAETAYHSSEVEPHKVFATLFFFDGGRGYNADAPILGPKNGTSSTQSRDPAGHTPASLVETVEILRRWEELVTEGKRLSALGETQHALRSFRGALELCQATEYFPNHSHYGSLALREIKLAS